MLKKLTNILLTFAMFTILNVANANEFPNKTITIVCNWSAGGGARHCFKINSKICI